MDRSVPVEAGSVVPRHPGGKCCHAHRCEGFPRPETQNGRSGVRESDAPDVKEIAMLAGDRDSGRGQPARGAVLAHQGKKSCSGDRYGSRPNSCRIFFRGAIFQSISCEYGLRNVAPDGWGTSLETRGMKRGEN